LTPDVFTHYFGDDIYLLYNENQRFFLQIVCQ